MKFTPVAIPTRYNGYRFRSRLEARWAVFFDHVGIKYEYESAGFALPSRRYLPDFYLPQFKSWAEVKPCDGDLDWTLAAELCEATDRTVIGLIGTPSLAWYPFMNVLDFVPASQLPPGVARALFFDWIDLGESALRGTPALSFTGALPAYPVIHPPRAVAALNAARGARFEFGETGAR